MRKSVVLGSFVLGFMFGPWTPQSCPRAPDLDALSAAWLKGLDLPPATDCGANVCPVDDGTVCDGKWCGQRLYSVTY